MNATNQTSRFSREDIVNFALAFVALACYLGGACALDAGYANLGSGARDVAAATFLIFLWLQIP